MLVAAEWVREWSVHGEKNSLTQKTEINYFKVKNGSDWHWDLAAEHQSRHKYVLLQNILQTSWPQTSFPIHWPQGRAVAPSSQVFIGVNKILHTKLRKRTQAPSNKMQGLLKGVLNALESTKLFRAKIHNDLVVSLWKIIAWDMLYYLYS